MLMVLEPEQKFWSERGYGRWAPGGVFLMEAEARNVLLPATSCYCLLSHVKYALDVDEEEDENDGQN